jgi:Fic family protein
MFDAKFQYTNKIINNLMEISAIKEFILNSQITPSYDLLLRNKAIISSSYNSTSIEGNPLDFKQVTELFNLKQNNRLNEVNLNKSEIEVLNYFKTIENLDKYKKIDEETVLDIHKNIAEKTLDDSSMAGRFRDSQVVIGNLRTGKLNLVLPSPIEVPYLIRELLDWLNIQNDLNPIILAGIFHYEFVRIHPFVDGNGRTARALATLILLLKDFDIKGYFSLDEYYNQDRQSYYAALQSADKSHDLTEWLEYFSTGFLVSLSNVKDDVVGISHFDRKLNEKIKLNEKEIRILEFLEENNSIRNKDVQELLDLSSQGAHAYLRKLIEKGLIKSQGKGRSTVYIRNF